MDNERINKADIFSLPDEQADIARRRLTAERVLTVLDKAIKEAEKKGYSDKAAQLKDRVNLIQDALDKASHLGNSGSSDNSDIDNDNPENNKKDVDQDDQADSEDSAEDKNADVGKDSDKEAEGQEKTEKDNQEKGKNQSNESDSNDESDHDDSSDSGETEDTGNETNSNSEESSEIGPKNNKSKSSQSSASSDKAQDSDNDQANSDSESSNSEKNDHENDSQEKDNQENKNSSASDKDGSKDSDNQDTNKPANPKTTPKKVYIDPFNSQTSQDPDTLPPGTEVESVEDSLKRILSNLDPDAKEGAVEALKDRLSQLQESLTEDYTGKSIAEMSTDEFNDLINSSLDLADKVIKVSYSTDLDSRIKEIKADASDTIKNRELDAEDNAIINKEHKNKIAANEKESDRYARTNLKSMQSFSKTIYRAIADQIDSVEDEEDSWSVIDRRHEDDPSIIVPGKKMDDLPEGEIPSIDLYIDQSSSFDDRDIRRAKAAVSSIVEFEKRGEIKLNIYYFANHVYS